MPLVWIYRRMYGLAIWFAVLSLRRYRTIETIYLTRGCAKNDITPGISDIDLVIVTTNDSKETQSIQRTLRRLGMITAGLLEYYPRQVQTVATLEHRWRTSPLWQHRLHEGKRSWIVLYGADILGSLPPLTEAQRIRACYAEMNRWWLLFAQEMAKTEQQHCDRVMHNIVCYKAVSELLNLEWAMQTGEYPHQRRESLDRSDSQLTRKLRAVASQKFLALDNWLMDETLGFLLTFFSDLWDRFCKHPFLSIYPEMGQTVDCEPSELQSSEQTAQGVRVLCEYVRARWGQKCLDIQAVKSAFWDLKDLLLIVSIDGKILPTVRDIANLIRRWSELQNQQIFLFLRLGSVIFPLTPVIPQDLHRGILTPATAPDVFLQLGVLNVYWTDHTRWYLSDWRSNEQWTHADSRKQSQLDVITRSVENQKILYPLTVPAIERRIDNDFGRLVGRTGTHA